MAACGQKGSIGAIADCDVSLMWPTQLVAWFGSVYSGFL